MNHIHKYIISFILLSLTFTMFSCDDDVNDWPVEDIENRLFKPILFESSILRPTSIQIKYSRVPDAVKYIFQFSKDDFASVEQEVVILSDTLTAFSESKTNPMKTEYRTTFDALDGTSEYSVRMYAENTDASLKSKFSMFEFITPAEQIFKKGDAASNYLIFRWVPGAVVTNLVVKQEETLIENRTLSADEKLKGEAKLENLTMGTLYTATIHRGDILRGTVDVKTTGIINSAIYKVPATANCTAINSAMQAMVAGGHKNITVEFEAGKTYEIPHDDGTEIKSQIIIPTGVENISFVGTADANGNYPILSKGTYTIKSTVNDVTFQNLNLTANAAMLFNIGGKTFNNVLFENCNISNLNSIVRLYKDGETPAVANNITINNCRVSKTGGWGMLNVGAGNTIGSITVTNSTLTEINTRFADVRVKTNIVFKNVTVCNFNEKMSHLWLLDNNSAPTVRVENLILAGPNGGVKLNSTNGNYSNIGISYGGSYKTNDLIEDQRPLANITEVPLGAEGLFVDPLNGDFHIKSSVGFAGTGVAGDPRWFD